MDHRLIAAFAVLASVFAVVGAVSLLSDESVGVTVPEDTPSFDYSPDLVLDLTDPSYLDTGVNINVDVVEDGAFGFNIPWTVPSDFKSGGYNTLTGYSFRYGFTEDHLFVSGDADGNPSGAAKFTISYPSYKYLDVYITFNPVSVEDYVDYTASDFFSSSPSDGLSFIIPDGEVYEYELPAAAYDLQPTGVLNTSFSDFASLSEDGSKLIIDAPSFIDTNTGVYSLYLPLSDDPCAGYCIKFRVAHDDWVFDYDEEVCLTLGVTFEDGILLRPLIPNGENGGYFSFECSSWPSGLHSGHINSFGGGVSSAEEFYYGGTPDAVGVYPVTVTATDLYLGDEYTFDITFYVGDYLSVLFSVPIVSNDSIVDVFYGMTVPVDSIPVFEDPSFTGWYSDSDCTVPFDFESPILEDTVIYAGWNESVEPEPEPPVSDGVVSNDPPDDGMDVPLGLLIILGLVVVVGLVAVAGGRRQ